MHRLALGVVGLAVGVAAVTTIPWNYDQQSADGPRYWAEQQMECLPIQEEGECNEYGFAACSGQRQSPIAIQPEATPRAKPSFLHFWTEPGMEVDSEGKKYTYDRIMNNGHSVEVRMLSSRLLLTTSMKPQTYVLTEIHHKMPAEHLLNGTRHDLEQQFIFVPADTVPAAGQPWMAQGDELRVSLLYTTAKEQARQIVESERRTVLEQVSSHFDKVKVAGDVLFLFRFEPWVDLAGDDVFVYDGSATTPPCREDVAWVVSSAVRHVAPETFEKLQRGHRAVVHPAFGNARPVQPVRARRVTKRRLVQPIRGEEFSELVERRAAALEPVEVRGDGLIVPVQSRTSGQKLKASLQEAVMGLVAALVLAVTALLVVALVKHDAVPLSIIPAWLGGMADAARERWETTRAQFGTYIPSFDYGDLEEDDDEEEEEEDEEDEEDEENEEDEEDL